MWILLLEAGVALVLLLLIVWWTMPRKSKPEKNDE
jgi:phage shock protein PspC (stress-responsive transcriptional regulator)